MFGSEIIDVAIGIVFLYLLLSLLASAVHEMLEVRFKLRAADLERGLKELLADPILVASLYNHPLVNALFQGTYPPPNRRKLPTYIPARTFALALMDIVQPAGVGVPSGTAGATLPQPAVVTGPAAAPPPAPPPTTAALRNSIVLLPPSPSRTALLSLVDAAGTDAAIARQNIEDWYNASMDRVSGWYKRRTQFFLFLIGIVLVSVANADTIKFTQYLSTNKTARDLIVTRADIALKSPLPQASKGPTATSSPKPTLKPTPMPTGSAAAVGGSPTPTASPRPRTEPAPAELLNTLGWLHEQSGIPFGWIRKPADPGADDERVRYYEEVAAYDGDWRRMPETPEEVILKVFGLFLTAIAITLGAPFWFDLLNKFMVVRSTIKPQEKSLNEGSKS